MTHHGCIACGHQATAQAAEEILRAGGNAYDAIIAAFYAACVAEPVLASLGGGGFLLAQPRNQAPCIYDFFVQTPRQKRDPTELDFYPIHADFGETKQQFHIGLGSIATPGAIKGIFDIHRDLGSLPMRELTAPAIELAQNGVTIDALQAYIFSIVEPIYSASEAVRKIFHNRNQTLLQAGDTIVQRDLAHTLNLLARHGDQWFYQDEPAQLTVELCSQHGGTLSMEDLQHYQVIKRNVLATRYRDAQIITNPPPSSGGLLINIALEALKSFSPTSFTRDAAQTHHALADVFKLTNQIRTCLEQLDSNLFLHSSNPVAQVLSDQQFAEQITALAQRHHFNRGTTHMSIIDRYNNIASMTVSNGEGCGHMIPGCGIVLNNMLGEEDLNPLGFFQWQPDQRIASMMAPTIINFSNQRTVVLGSGGSNRLRTAILQTIVNLADFNMSLNDAVQYPRLHFENDRLDIEAGVNDAVYDYLANHFSIRRWQGKNLYFGGVHAVSSHNQLFEAAGDERRGGVAVVL